MSIISYPTPPYSNPPIQSQFFKPSAFDISSITLGWNTTVTTTVNHNYVIGQLIRLVIPSAFGCYQLNEQTGYVLSIPSANQVVISINSVGFDPYVAASAKTPAQILGIGDINSGTTNASGLTNQGTTIPGAFINTSPFPS